MEVDLSSSNITDLNLTIAKPSEANFLSGTVKDSSGSVIEDAYVYAWSDDGREVSDLPQVMELSQSWFLLVPFGILVRT